jgi:hypothetical protein
LVEAAAARPKADMSRDLHMWSNRADRLPDAGASEARCAWLTLAILVALMIVDHFDRKVARPSVASLRKGRTVMVVVVASGLQVMCASAIYAWLASCFNRFYGVAPENYAGDVESVNAGDSLIRRGHPA